MNQSSKSTDKDKLLEQISRQLELLIKFVAVIATDKDFASHSQEHQIALLGKLGFRNIELSNIFGIKPQNVNNAFRKYKVK